METLLLGTKNLCYLLFDTTGVQLIPYLTCPWSSKMPSSVRVVTFHSSKILSRTSAITGEHEGHFCPSLPCLSCASHSTEDYFAPAHKNSYEPKEQMKKSRQRWVLVFPLLL